MYTTLRIETDRLHLRWFDLQDAEFVYRLVNDPQWLQFIGDKQVTNLDEARDYIENGPWSMYSKYGYGLNRIALKDDDTPIGFCGLLQRDSLPDCDLGFALLPEYREHGYAFEAAHAVLRHAFNELHKTRITAIVSPDNTNSIELLRRLDFEREDSITLEPGQRALDLYAIERDL